MRARTGRRPPRHRPCAGASGERCSSSGWRCKRCSRWPRQLPGLILLFLSGAGHTGQGTTIDLLTKAPLIAGGFLLTYALLVAVLVRLVGSIARPGWHADEGRTGWALWFSEALMAGARGVLRPLYLSVFTRSWLRLAGIKIGKRAEVSTVVGLNRMSSFAEESFATDDVVFAGARARGRLAARRADRGRERDIPRQPGSWPMAGSRFRSGPGWARS